MVLIFILIVLLIPIFIFIGIYNGLIGSKNRVEEAFSGIDVQLKKRYDLIPNLVSTVKQYMKHEEKILTEITMLRSKAIGDDLSTEEKVHLNNELSTRLNALNVVVENYPELKANQGFENLQRSLNEIESQISASRRTYNASVREFNNKVEQFPSNIVANMKGFQKYEFYKALEEEKKRIDVEDFFS